MRPARPRMTGPVIPTIICVLGISWSYEGMLSVVQAARVVTGSILIIAGLIAIPLPLTPGLPLIIVGLAFGFSWHPKGLRLLRVCRVKWGRIFRKKNS